MNRLSRSIPCSILISELTYLYDVYKRTYPDDNDYNIKAFKRNENKINISEPDNPKNELIIEYGFNLFILANILMMKN